MNEHMDYTCEVCASAVHFTAQKTIYQLHLAVKQELEKLASVLSLRGFEVGGLDSSEENATIHLHPYNDQDDSNTNWLAESDALRKALQTQQVQRYFDGQCWFCFIPTMPAQSSHNIWVAEFSIVVNEPDLQRMLILSRIYYNCASHIGIQHTDALTGLKNRQALSDRLSRILKNKRRAKDLSNMNLPCICMLDIDFFKRVNDEFGHLYGDEVLLLFSGLMKKIFRENDFLCRYGGEEFVILLDSSLELETRLALERFREAIDTYLFPQVGHVTVSIGFVHMNMGELPSSLIDKADKALYYAKEHGRNQVCSYQMLQENSLIEESETKIEVELFELDPCQYDQNKYDQNKYDQNKYDQNQHDRSQHDS